MAIFLAMRFPLVGLAVCYDNAGKKYFPVGHFTPKIFLRTWEIVMLLPD